MLELGEIGSSSAAVVGAVVGGAAGVLGAGLTAFLNSRSQRAEREAQREELERERQDERVEHRKAQMLNAALAFATALEWVRSRANFVHVEDLDQATISLEGRLEDGLVQMGAISLLFGADSDTLDYARLSHYRAISAIGAVRELATVPLDEREGHSITARMGSNSEELSDALRKFTTAAASAIEHTVSQRLDRSY